LLSKLSKKEFKIFKKKFIEKLEVILIIKGLPPFMIKITSSYSIKNFKNILNSFFESFDNNNYNYIANLLNNMSS
jgi:hypothetical protein